MGGERPKGEGAKAEDGKDVRWMASNGSFGFAKAVKCQCPLTERTPYLSIAVTRSLDGKSVSQVMKQF